MSQFIFIDSKQRSFTTDPIENCSYIIQDAFPNSEKDISIENVIIPCSFYSINENNYQFLLGTTQNVSLSYGNYTNATFVTELQTRMNAVGLGVTFVATISSSTNKLSITASSGNFTITSNTKNYKYLGLNRSDSKASTSSVWVSECVLDLSGTSYIDILTDLPLASSNVANSRNGLLNRIWVNSASFNKIFYSSESFDFIKLLTSRLNSLRITLLDDNGDILNLNGCDYSIVLEVCDGNRK
jgi:hypothetical protein